MADLSATIQGTASRQRASRDTYLGAAAFALAVSYALGLARLASGYIGLPLTRVGTTGVVLILIGELVKTLGFAWACAGFLGDQAARRRRFRRAAYILAGGHSAAFLGSALAYLIVPYLHYRGWPDVFSLTVHLARAVYYALAAAAALFVASSFGHRKDWKVRNRLLGWGAVTLGFGSALVLFYDIGSAQGGLSGFGMGNVVSQTQTLLASYDAFWLVATVVAAVGFFSASRGTRLPADLALTRRGRFLTVAAIALVIASAMGVADFIILLRFNWWAVVAPDVRDLWRFCYFLFGALGDAALLVGSLLATLGFFASRRWPLTHRVLGRSNTVQ